MNELSRLVVPVKPKPVFLQTGFRTGGTWLWSRFRAAPGTLGFMEPLNEFLASATAETIDRLTPETLRLGHPGMTTPYFEEFRPLLKADGAGIAGYRIRQGLESYFCDGDSQNPGLRDYLSSLIDMAARRGKVPVLKFTRMLGRAGWLRRQFPQACQILLLRDPFRQFLSGYRQAVERDNYTFLMIPAFTLSRVLSTPDYGPIAAETGVPFLPMEDEADCFGVYTRVARQQNFAEALTSFLVFFMLSYECSIAAADVVLDLEELVLEPDRRVSIARSLYDTTGVAVDLSDASLVLTDLRENPLRDAMRSGAERLLARLPSEMKASVDYVGAALARL